MALEHLREHMRETATPLAMARAELTYTVLTLALPVAANVQTLLNDRITPWEAPR